MLFGAIDLGASSGRVIAGQFTQGKLSLTEVYRFANAPESSGAELVWNFDQLFAEIRLGLRELGARAERLDMPVTSIGIDTWAVDYGLLAKGELLAQPCCYRDPLNDVGVRAVHESVSFADLYRINGLQFLPFNTIYQLSKQRQIKPQLLESAEKLLLLPDLIGFQLTGNYAMERTNASSTGLLDATSRELNQQLIQQLGLEPKLFAPLRDAGTELGELGAGYGPRLQGAKVVLVGSHDTASAVVGVPATKSGFAFLSSGTWSLLGAEIEQPILTDQARQANFTNELGVDGRVRFLKNLSGLWLLTESIRHYQQSGSNVGLAALLIAAAKLSPTQRIDVSDPRFISPGEMPIKMAQQLESSGQKKFESLPELIAIILHSLAESYAAALAQLREITGLSFDTLHIIGGGSQNNLLNQLTADATGLRVLAGPVEATAIGNLMIQARTAGLVGPDLEQLRKVILDSDFESNEFLPRHQAKGDA